MKNIEGFKKLLYSKAISRGQELGLQVRTLLENIFSPDITANSETIYEIYKILEESNLPEKQRNFYWECLMEFLWELEPNLLTHFSSITPRMFCSSVPGMCCRWINDYKIFIPKNIEEIYSNAIYNCTISELEIEKGSKLKYITLMAFWSENPHRASLVHNLDLSNTQIEKLYNLGAIHAYTLSLPNTVKYIGYNALTDMIEIYFPAVDSIKDLDVTFHSDAMRFDQRNNINQTDFLVRTKTDSAKLLRDGNGIKLGPEFEGSKCRVQ